MPFIRPGRSRAALGLLLVMCTFPTVAQDAWRLDSLMTTWTVQRTIREKHIPFSMHFGPDSAEVRAEWKDTSPVLPDFLDDAVAAAVDLYGGTKRTEFRLLLGMAEVYRPMIAKQLADEGLPTDLADLPMALSAMNVHCTSRTGEAGLWMLTWPVAIRYGLQVDAYVDERRNDVRSTIAACRYLKDLHARYGDWPLTVLAFAAGPAQLEAARIRSGGATTVQSLYPYLDPMHRPVIPALIAMHWLAHEASGPHPRPILTMPWEPVDTLFLPRAVPMASVANSAKVPLAQLRAVNPELAGGMVVAGRRTFMPRIAHARIPEVVADALTYADTFHTRLPQDTLPADSVAHTGPPGTHPVYYRIKSGDALGSIAQRHKVRVAQIKEWNGLKGDLLDVGEELVIHVPDAKTGARNTPTVPVRTSTNDEPSFTWYTVRSGDSLDLIARRHRGVSAQEIMRYNGISHRIKPGQRIKIPH